MTVQHNARNDFDGDGHSDILWRGNNGIVTDWLGTGNGGFVANWTSFNHNFDPSSIIVGNGDFNGDGREDMLLQSSDGLLISLLNTPNSGFQADWENAIVVPTSWQIWGTADVNGDKLTDILWRNDNGQFTDWLTSPDPATVAGVHGATFVQNWGSAHFNVPTTWNLAGLGDFNGDGHADILWHDDKGQLTEWAGQGDGGFSDNLSTAFPAVPLEWQVVGTGDFNGDSMTDILWRRDDGMLVDWLGQTNGGFTVNWNNSAVGVSTNWQVVGTGDYNGDGRDDILWRNDAGEITDWLGTGSGGFVDNWANAHVSVPTEWQVQPNVAGFGFWDY